MGCSSPQNARIPNIPPQHYNRLLQVSSISHPLNVNKKYQHISRINENIQVGKGFKKTYAYDCLKTKQELQSLRKQFWQTRVNGSPQCWNAIHQATISKDQNQAKQILQKMKISMLNNSIQMCVDHKFNKYQVPVFCINQPQSLSMLGLEDKNLNLTYEDKQLQVKIRSTKYPNEDIVFKQKASTQIIAIKNKLKLMKQLKENTVIRFFFSGRQINNQKTLGNYNIQTGLIIQAMIIE